ncbi:MAG: hypothetical protein ACPGJS_15485, partial [Flammeovirgaceae bacterium]
ISLVPIVWGLYDWWEEKIFKQKGIKTIAKVVGSLAARHASAVYFEGAYAEYTAPEGIGGRFLILEYEVQNGEVYQVKSKKVFRKNPTEVSIIYNPDDPTDLITDGFYKVGNMKYYRILGGAAITLLIIFSQLF